MCVYVWHAWGCGVVLGSSYLAGASLTVGEHGAVKAIPGILQNLPPDIIENSLVGHKVGVITREAANSESVRVSQSQSGHSERDANLQ